MVDRIPLGGKGDIFSAIGHRLHNTGGRTPSKRPAVALPWWLVEGVTPREA
jgi:hypothetical protein